MSETNSPSPIALTFSKLPVSEIHPDPKQPRKQHDEHADKELNESIRKHGLLQPIVVRKDGDRYVILVGERRWRCITALGWEEVPCLIADVADDSVAVLQLIENVQRQDLSPLDVAEHLKQLFERLKADDDDRATLRALAGITGKSLGWVSEKLALSRLPEPVKALQDSGAVKNSRVLIGLSKLNESDPDAAAALIKDVEDGKKVTAEQISEIRGTKRQAKSEDVQESAGSAESAQSESKHDAESEPKSSPQAQEKASPVATQEAAEQGSVAPPTPRPPRKKKVVEVAKLIGVPEDMSPEEMLEAFAEAYSKLLERSEVPA